MITEMMPNAESRIAAKMWKARSEWEAAGHTQQSQLNGLAVCHSIDAVNEAYRDGFAQGIAAAISVASKVGFWRTHRELIDTIRALLPTPPAKEDPK